MRSLMYFIYSYVFLMLLVLCHAYYLMIKNGKFYEKEFKGFYKLINSLQFIHPYYLFQMVNITITQQIMFFRVKRIKKEVEYLIERSYKTLKILKKNTDWPEVDKLISNNHANLKIFKEELVYIKDHLGYESKYLDEEGNLIAPKGKKYE